jgi:hypothetical protein
MKIVKECQIMLFYGHSKSAVPRVVYTGSSRSSGGVQTTMTVTIQPAAAAEEWGSGEGEED